MADRRNIAANLARLRLDRGMTQEELAAKAGLSRLALGRIERGGGRPPGTYSNRPRQGARRSRQGTGRPGPES